MNEAKCRGVDGQRVLMTHLRDCNTSGCEGCAPCRQRHCGCGRHLRDGETWACPRCVGTTRGHLQRISDLCRLAPTAAAEMGAGGAVKVLAGYVATASTSHAYREWALSGTRPMCTCAPNTCPDRPGAPTLTGPTCWSCTHDSCQRLNGMPACPGLRDWLEYADPHDPDAELHPLTVVGGWDLLVAEHLDHDRSERVTVPTSAEYLARQLTYLAGDETFGWDDLASEVRACHGHVERVMLVAPYVQRGAPCPLCGTARLEHRYGHDQAHDQWTCPKCDGTWTDHDYRAKVDALYLEHADRLTASQIAEQYRIPEATVRKWAERGTVKRLGYDGSRRQLYDVRDVKAMRDAQACA